MDVNSEAEAKFTLTLWDLQRALGAVKHVVPKRPLVPVLGGVLFEAHAQGRGVLARATDYRTYARLRVDARVAQGRRLMDHKQLAAHVAAIARGKSAAAKRRLLVTIEGEDERAVFVSAEELRGLKVACYRADEYPGMAPEAPLFAEADSAQLAHEVQRVGPVASGEKELERWCALRFTKEERSLQLLASDQFRIAVGTLPAVTAQGSDCAGAAAPWADTMVKLVKLLDGGRVRIGAEPTVGGWVSLATDDLLVVTRGIGGDAPTLSRIETGTLPVHLERELLLDAVERGGAFSKAYGAAAEGVRLHVGAEGLRVLPVHRGRYDEVCAPVVEAGASSVEASFVTDPGRLAAGLKLFAGKRVTLYLHPDGPRLPLTLREADEDPGAFRYVLMPIGDKARSGVLEAAPDGWRPAWFECMAGALRDALTLVGKGVMDTSRAGRAIELDGRDGTLLLRAVGAGTTRVERVEGSRAGGSWRLDYAELLGLVKAGVSDLDDVQAYAEPVKVVGAGREAGVMHLRGYALPVAGYAVLEDSAPRATREAVGEVDLDELRRAVEHVRRSAGVKPGDAQCYGVKLELGDGLLTLVSSDRRRVATAAIEVSQAPDGVRREAVLGLDQLLGLVDRARSACVRLVDRARSACVRLGWSDEELLPEVSLDCGGAAIVSRSLIAKFFAYQRAFELAVAGRGVAIREEVIDAVKEAISLGKAVEPQPWLDITFGPAGIVIAPAGVEGGKVGGLQLCAPIDGLTEEHTARYLGAHLLDALESFEAPLVRLHVEGQAGPLGLTQVRGELGDPKAFRYVLGHRREQG